jgi:hypothetical protein
VSDPWADEGFGGENDWGEESVGADLEEDTLFDSVEPEDDGDDFDSDDEE